VHCPVHSMMYSSVQGVSCIVLSIVSAVFYYQRYPLRTWPRYQLNSPVTVSAVCSCSRYQLYSSVNGVSCILSAVFSCSR
jgi:hypothetical protein